MSEMESYFDKIRRRARFFIFIPLAIAAFALLIGWLVMWLWNAILPEVLGVGVLTYWQAVGLLVLCRLLFGGIGGGRGRGSKWHHKNKRFAGPPRHMREKWMQMSDEERARFKEEWRERCRKRGDN